MLRSPIRFFEMGDLEVDVALAFLGELYSAFPRGRRARERRQSLWEVRH